MVEVMILKLNDIATTDTANNTGLDGEIKMI